MGERGVCGGRGNAYVITLGPTCAGGNPASTLGQCPIMCWL